MSVGAVARRSGLEVQLIAEIEGGQTNPDLVEIHKLAVALDMRPDELLRRSIEDDPPT
jgi:transcriptional regulator with XRE-family HTH domain